MKILLFLALFFLILFAAQMILFSVPPGPTKREERRLFALIFRMIKEGEAEAETDIACYHAMEILAKNSEFKQIADTPQGHPAYLFAHGDTAFRIILLMAGGGTIIRIAPNEWRQPAQDPDGTLENAISAIKAGDLQTAARCFESGLDVNARHVASGARPLHLAAVFGRLDIMRWLLDHGADINARDATGYTPLLSCLWMTAQRVLQNNPDVKFPPEREKLTAQMPPPEDSKAAILFLLQNGADVDIAGDKGLQAIHWAVLTRDMDIIGALLPPRKLIEISSRAMARDKDGNTPLILAAGLGDTKAIELLARRGADVDGANDFSQTALITAALNRKARAASRLLSLGANPSLKTEEGLTALHFAAHNDDADTLEILIRGGADMEIKDNGGFSALMTAASEGRENALRTLCENGADTESSLPSGQTPIQAASANNHPGCVAILLRHGADINHRDNRGATALCWAARSGHFAVVRALREAGARTDLASDGLTPEEFARMKGHGDIADYLAAKI